MKPRQLFGNPGHLGEGEEPTALPLEGVGGKVGFKPYRPHPAQPRPHVAGAHNSGVIHLHLAFHLETPSAPPTKQVLLSPQPHIHPGGGLGHRRMNGTRTSSPLFL